MEVLRSPGRRPVPRVAVFDFDGTLSLLRGGWVEIMVAMMLNVLRELPGTTEPDDALKRRILDLILSLNGRPTVFQMRALADEVRRRGGNPQTPEDYTNQFVAELVTLVNRRKQSGEEGLAQRDDFLVPGSRAVLTALVARGVELTLASGTVVTAVKSESQWLGLSPFFEERIFGPELRRQDSFAKIDVMQALLQRHQCEGDVLIGFGDGMVEIQNLKALGGLAVGVASDESGRSGRIEPWKRELLADAGADLIIGDYRELPRLLDWLQFPATPQTV